MIVIIRTGRRQHKKNRMEKFNLMMRKTRQLQHRQIFPFESKG
ncbi:hypothetical protein C7S16_2111 [Burkholderia thailandensis]|uniref:Transposase n=1 Tax=Burkholderia thailandensis TaxID=57975 RepID=A0AAW9CU01_BURTH|nr:hypothetical protein [Burkholderia thailandensis]MDW9253912.1 hypothetical protein [Burkholderia thailandensis]